MCSASDVADILVRASRKLFIFNIKKLCFQDQSIQKNVLFNIANRTNGCVSFRISNVTLSVLQDEPLLKSGFVDGPWKRPLLKALEQASVPLQPGHSPFLSESQTIRTHISAIRAGAATTSHTLRGAEVKLLSSSAEWE